jgi:hypothetical protein
MDDAPDEYIAKVIGCNIGISFFEGELEPVIVLVLHPVEGQDIQVALAPDHLEGMLPEFIGACIRARVVAEMVTIYPEQRDEIIQNLMFRWTGTIVEDTNGEPT